MHIHARGCLYEPVLPICDVSRREKLASEIWGRGTCLRVDSVRFVMQVKFMVIWSVRAFHCQKYCAYMLTSSLLSGIVIIATNIVKAIKE